MLKNYVYDRIESGLLSQMCITYVAGILVISSSVLIVWKSNEFIYNKVPFVISLDIRVMLIFIIALIVLIRVLKAKVVKTTHDEVTEIIHAIINEIILWAINIILMITMFKLLTL